MIKGADRISGPRLFVLRHNVVLRFGTTHFEDQLILFFAQ